MSRKPGKIRGICIQFLLHAGFLSIPTLPGRFYGMIQGGVRKTKTMRHIRTDRHARILRYRTHAARAGSDVAKNRQGSGESSQHGTWAELCFHHLLGLLPVTSP